MSSSVTLYEVNGGDGTIRDGSWVTWGWSGNGAVYGGGAYIAVGKDDTNLEYRAYKHVVISSLAGKTIISATLNWHYGYKETDSGGPPNVTLYTIDDYGTLGTEDWNSVGAVSLGIVLTGATGIGWKSNDVKTRLQALVDVSVSHFGISWQPSAGNDDWYALGHSSGSYKAYLSITYCSLPAVPTPATAQIIDVDNVRVNWTDNSSGESQETEFRIERSVDGGAYALLTTKSPDVTEHIDDTVSAGHTYKYRVRAGNQAGDSNWVETDTVTPTAGGMQVYMNC